MVSSTQSGLLAASSTQVYLLLAFILWFGRHYITCIFICSINSTMVQVVSECILNNIFRVRLPMSASKISFFLYLSYKKLSVEFPSVTFRQTI